MADLLSLPFCLWGSFALESGQWIPPLFMDFWWASLFAVLISLPVFIRSGMYRAMIRHSGEFFFVTLFKSIGLSVLLTMIPVTIIEPASRKPLVWIAHTFFLLVLIGGIRWLVRSYHKKTSKSIRNDRVPILIYGAGAAGMQIGIALQQSIELRPVAFLDDDKNKQGREVRGLIVHSPANLEGLVDKMGIRSILLALPSVSRSRRQEILRVLEPLPVRVLNMPGLAELGCGTKKIDDILDVSEQDLLGRDPVPPNEKLLKATIVGKSVMVTGGGGSIGSELCRQIIRLQPSRLVVVERSEFNLYSIERELRHSMENMSIKVEIVPILGCVMHYHRMRSVIGTFGVQTLYHAAAYKHVPIVEYNPIEGVQNNILGTFYTAKAAISGGVETFVLISTDKAVRPTNVMGATKRFAELILQGLAETQSKTRFTMVRFGNVLASSGSVIPLFREQIKRGGPITVTDSDIRRYFMTIPEATQLVIQAGSMGKGGDVFVLDMGEPVEIFDMARRMIHLSGLTLKDDDNPSGDIEIQIVGLRPGEKLYEELLIGDNVLQTNHSKIMRAQEEQLSWDQVNKYLDGFLSASKNFDYLAIRSLLIESVNGYKPTSDIQDWVWIKRADRYFISHS